jgi:hypothetical protein
MSSVVRSVVPLLLIACALNPPVAAAQDRLDGVAAAIDRAMTPITTENATLPRVAAVLGTTPETLRAEHASLRLGWGDLFIAHRIAARGGHPMEKVVAARRSPAVWGTIAEEAGVEADAIVQDVATVWPDAARATPGGSTAPAAPPAAAGPAPARGLGGRVLDLLRGGADDKSGARAQDDPTSSDRPAEEIRDKMIRGGGTRTR